MAAIKILDNQILDLLETEQDIDHEIDESSKFCEGIYTRLLQIDDKLNSWISRSQVMQVVEMEIKLNPSRREQELTLSY